MRHASNSSLFSSTLTLIAYRHNILAYRFSSGSSGSITSGSDCNGEPPAGKNLLGLMEKLVRDLSSALSLPHSPTDPVDRFCGLRRGVQDVLLVVTRWYGGTPMGGLRFRVIDAVRSLAFPPLPEKELILVSPSRRLGEMRSSWAGS